MRPPSGTREVVGKVPLILMVAALIGLPVPRVMAVETQEQGFADLSIQDLMNIEITSVSKKAQKLSEAPAAIFVITNEDIRRSGARNVPEVLRLAPGVDVAAIGGGRYAVSIRGFTGRFGNKLLVLIDGRSIYTPIFSGVIWEAQGPVLEDIERIEIIRGPGAAIWGANAVNGVINIISKHPTDTQGILASAGTGTEDRGFATLRYGGRIAADTSYRVYGKTEAHGESDDAAGNPGNDRSHSSRAGFRVDSQQNDGQLSVQGETYNFAAGDRIEFPQVTPDTSQTPPVYSQTRNIQQHDSGGDLLGRWDKTLTPTQDLSLQAYVDFSSFVIDEVTASRLKTLDFQFEHRIGVGSSNDVTSGLSYRVMSYRTESQELSSFTPDSRDLRVASGFIQDQIRLTPESLRMTLGAKVERDSYSGTQFMPDARLLWNVDRTSQIWASASKAVRTPSVGERDAGLGLTAIIPPNTPQNPAPVPIRPMTIPDAFGSEQLNALQLGYRSEIASNLSLDLTGFMHHYKGLRDYEFLTDKAYVTSANNVPYAVLPFDIYNGLCGQEIGVEAAADWRVSSWWRLQTSYARTRIKQSTPTTENTDPSLDASPRGLLSLRSSMEIADTHFDLWLRHVSQRLSPAFSSYVPEYTTLDSVLSWKLPYNFDVSLIGKDLLDERHPEFVADVVSSQPLTVERSAYVRITWTH